MKISISKIENEDGTIEVISDARHRHHASTTEKAAGDPAVCAEQSSATRPSV